MPENQRYVFCRLCLQSANGSIDIFNPKGTNGFIIWEIITELIEFEVSSDDGWPTKICRSCLKKLTDYKTFKRMCIESRNLFMKLPAKRRFELAMEVQERDAVDPLAMDAFSIDQPSDDPLEESIETEVALEMEESDKCGSLEIYLPSHFHPEGRPTGVEEGTESEITEKMEAGDLRDPLETDSPTFAEVQSEEEAVEPGGGIESKIQIQFSFYNDEHSSEEECSLIVQEDICSLEEINSQEAVLQCGGDNSVVAVGIDSPGKCVQRSLRAKQISNQSEVVGSVYPEVRHKGVGDAPEKRRGSSKEDENVLLKAGGSEEKEPRRRKGMKKMLESVEIKKTVYEEWRENQKERKRKSWHRYYANLSIDKKKALGREKMKRDKERLAKMNEEERKRFLEHKRVYNRRRTALIMTDEEKKKLYKRQYENLKRRVAEMSEEEREVYRRRRNEMNVKWLASLSDARRAAMVARKKECILQRKATLKRKKSPASAGKSTSHNAVTSRTIAKTTNKKLH